MQYKLYENGSNDYSNILKEILKNRKIDDYITYLHLDSTCEIPYTNLNNMNEAVELFNTHYSQKNVISILIDEDTDGNTSGAVMYSYILKMNNKYPVNYIIHKAAKAHGLSDDVSIPEDTKLLIIPDAGTNDTDECKRLSSLGIDIIILDHHECDIDNPYAVIVNNQMSKNYGNKNLAGVGIVYKFIQALDDLYWNYFADDFIDLVALGLIGDSMDIRSYETRYLIDKGLQNIKNKFLLALIKAQSYSMGGKINIHNFQWYIVPVINAMIRVGSIEEKELLFRALAEQDEVFEYNKKATAKSEAKTVQEDIYNRSVRLCKNAKSRQDRLREKGVASLSDKIEANHMQDKVIITDASDDITRELTGVVAIKLAEKYNKPCILLSKKECKDKLVYGGSGRNFDNSPLADFKNIIGTCNQFNFARGHASAFGVEIEEEKLCRAREQINYSLKDTDFEAFYRVDFIMNHTDLSLDFIREVNKMETIVGQGIDDSLIVITDLTLDKHDFQLTGKKKNNILFSLDNGIKYIKNKCSEDDELYMYIQDEWNDEKICFNIIGKPYLFEYKGRKIPQVEIIEVEIVK